MYCLLKKKIKNMIEPIRPNDVWIEIPEFVIEIVNKMIKEAWDGEEAKISQKDVVDKILRGYPGMEKITTGTVYKKHWLDFEDLYRKVGWKVIYDKPGFNESYEPYFKFTKE